MQPEVDARRPVNYKVRRIAPSHSHCPFLHSFSSMTLSWYKNPSLALNAQVDDYAVVLNLWPLAFLSNIPRADAPFRLTSSQQKLSLALK
jgi:hypothetical protein